jgi:hypothetical protein
MAFKDYNRNQLITGLVLLAVVFIGAVLGFMFVYKFVGKLATTLLTLAAIVYYVWQYFHFKSNAKAKADYIGALRASLYKQTVTNHLVMILNLTNVAALLALVIMGWWFVAICGAVMSYITLGHVREAEALHNASLATR